MYKTRLHRVRLARNCWRASRTAAMVALALGTPCFAQDADANKAVKPGQFKPIPIMLGGVVYVATEVAQAAAVDAATGETLWSYDPESWRAGRPANIGFQHRGVAAWRGSVEQDGRSRDETRIFLPTHDRRLIALDGLTGERVWHFQAIHHGPWDYDFPTPPQLVDITVDGRDIKALARVSKQAFAYVLDRVTGDPVWDIEELPVPVSDVPGERASETQPFPTKPVPFDRQGVSEDDLIDLTPELLAEAKKIASRFRMGPLFTPPSAGAGTLMLPSAGGGSFFANIGELAEDAGLDLTEEQIAAFSAGTTPKLVALALP